MATHFSILAWRIPWTEEPVRVQSIGSQSQTQLKLFSTHAPVYIYYIIYTYIIYIHIYNVEYICIYM